MRQVCTFKFEKWIERSFIEEQLALAILATESAFGKPKVRLYVVYLVSKDKPEAAIDVSTEVGEHIAKVFVGFMSRHIGEENFSVKRVEDNFSVKRVEDNFKEGSL